MSLCVRCAWWCWRCRCRCDRDDFRMFVGKGRNKRQRNVFAADGVGGSPDVHGKPARGIGDFLHVALSYPGPAAFPRRGVSMPCMRDARKLQVTQRGDGPAGDPAGESSARRGRHLRPQGGCSEPRRRKHLTIQHSGDVGQAFEGICGLSVRFDRSPAARLDCCLGHYWDTRAARGSQRIDCSASSFRGPPL